MLWAVTIPGGGEIRDVRMVVTTHEEHGRLASVRVDVTSHPIGTGWVLLLQAVAQAISEGLERGVPLASYHKTLRARRFEPNGEVIGDEHVQDCTSVVDYLVSALFARYTADGIPVA